MYKKNYAPKNRQQVAGGNEHLWIPEMQRKQNKEEKERYDENYVRIFKHN